MNTITIKQGNVSGNLSVPTSKSMSHRALILAALSYKKSTIQHILHCEDIELTILALQKMGFDIVVKNNNVLFSGKQSIPKETVHINIQNSGTSARLLTAVLAIQPFESIMDGTERMRERPMKDLLSPLQELGLVYEGKNDCLPIRIKSFHLNQHTIKLNAEKSSQFLSALLLIAPQFNEDISIDAGTTIASKSYIDLTLDMMKHGGIMVEEKSGLYYIPKGQMYEQKNWIVEGDYSSASYFIVAAAIFGNVAITNLNQYSYQGDKSILDIISKFGAAVKWKENKVSILKAQELKGIEYDMNHCPDIVPTVAVLALFATGKTILKNVDHLRYKESDRIEAIISNIVRIGGTAYTEGTNLIIEYSKEKLHAGKIATYNDHRIAMSFSIAGIFIQGIEIENPTCVNKSYPDFWKDLNHITNT